MDKITESAIEKFAIELLEKSGYQYIHGPAIAPDSETPERVFFEDVLLIDRLREALGRINPTVPKDCREDAVKQIRRLVSPELIANNEAFHRLLTEGIKVTFQKDGRSRGDYVRSQPVYLNAIMVASDGLEAKAGSISAGFTRFMAWKTADGKVEASPLIGQLETLIKGMFDKKTLLDLIRHFIVFEKSKKEDKETGIITIQTVKNLASYHQYYAVNRAVESTLRASGFIEKKKAKAGPFEMRESPESFGLAGVAAQPVGDRKGGVVFTTIQKFQPDEGNVYESLSERENIIVIADEAHRTQYGFKAKIIDDGDAKGKVVGKKIVYGFAKYLRDALPHATYLGFTGTPIESTDVNTQAVFGNYVDVNDIAQAVADGATVKIYYESRLAKITLSEEGKKLVAELDEEFDTVGAAPCGCPEQGEHGDSPQKAKAKWTQLEALVGSEKRVKQVSRDIVEHYAGHRQSQPGL